MDLKRDLNYAARTLRRSPAYALTATAVLGLALAANTVAFSFVNSVFLRPLAVAQPEQLVRIYTSYANGPRYFTVSYRDYRDTAGLIRIFSGVVADQPAPFSLNADGTSERVWGYAVSGNYFSVLGLRASAGRLFEAAEADAADSEPLLVLSHAFWRARFRGDPTIVGRHVLVNGRPATVVGVTPAGFKGLNAGLKADLWIPARSWHPPRDGIDPLQERGARGYFVVARLQPGVTVQQSAAALDVLARQLEATHPETNKGISFAVLPEIAGAVHPMMRGPFASFAAALWVTVSLVLLLACTNVAGLLLARGATRRKEIGVRLALGATRGRIVQQLLTESALLWLLSGAAGTALAIAIVRSLSSIQLPTDRPVFVDITTDVRVFGFSLLVTVGTAIVFAIMPAVTASKADPLDSVRGGAVRTASRSTLRATLVGGQVMLCVGLLIAAALCLRSLTAARHIDIGFEPSGVAMVSLDTHLHGYEWERSRRFLRELADRVSAAPEVEAAGLANRIPFELNVLRAAVEPAGTATERLPSVDWAVVDGGYFKTLRIRMVEGRVFSSFDTQRTSGVVVINKTLARRLWPRQSAVGRQVRVANAVREVVGVVEDGKYLTLGEEPTAFLYLPFEQEGGASMTLLVRGGDAGRTLARVREEVRAMDAMLPLFNVRTMQEHLAIAAFPARVMATLFGAFGGLALLLACVGVYGLLAYSVARRTREIGVRRALGARDSDVIALVIREALTPVAAGLAVGCALGILLSRVLRALLYGIGATDPTAYVAATAVLLVTASIACYIPAYRATRVEPMDALRHE